MLLILRTTLSLLLLRVLARPVEGRPLLGVERLGRGLPEPLGSLRPRNDGPISPRLLLINLFTPEAQVFLSKLDLSMNITVPGLSPLFPAVHCDVKYQLCQMTTGEGEINAAASASALFLSPLFNLTETYIMSAGIAGVNPNYGTLGDAGFSRFLIQVALQYELDSRELPPSFNGTTGYWSFGTTGPNQYPKTLYGTEVFEVNTNLLARVLDLAKSANLSDNANSASQRSLYGQPAAQAKPSVKRCDSVTSDNYFTGAHLGEAFANYTSLITNNTGTYCLTAQEDNAIAAALVRASKAGLADYGRYIVLRTASDFDRAPPQNSTYDWFEYAGTVSPGGFAIALDNLWNAGWPVIKEIVYDWPAWQKGTPPQAGFYGDVFGTISGLGLPASAGAG